MYGKLFASTFTGSMMASGPEVIAVWAYVIANTCKSMVELNPALLAAVIGSTPQRMSEAIETLCAEDANSRSSEERGRRLVREGQFQFRVVNHEKYRSIRNEDERREYNREAKRRERARDTQSNEQSMTVNDSQACQPIQKQKQIQKKEILSTPYGVSPRERGSSGSEGFDLFWQAYPRKDAKQSALKAFAKLAPSADFLDSMLESIKKQKTTQQWVDGFIPYGATWINGKRWEDELQPVVAPAQALTVPSAAVDKTAALLSEQAEAGRRAQSPEAQAARIAAMSRLKGVAA